MLLIRNVGLTCYYVALEVLSGLRSVVKSDSERECSNEVRVAVEDIALLATCSEVMINPASFQKADPCSKVSMKNLLTSDKV